MGGNNLFFKIAGAKSPIAPVLNMPLLPKDFCAKYSGFSVLMANLFCLDTKIQISQNNQYTFLNLRHLYSAHTPYTLYIPPNDPCMVPGAHRTGVQAFTCYIVRTLVNHSTAYYVRSDRSPLAQWLGVAPHAEPALLNSAALRR